MAVQVYSEVPGITSKQYDGMNQQVLGALLAAPGFISHVATPMEGGMAITEVWESEAAWNTFIEQTISPMLQAVGMSRPHAQVRTIHKIITRHQSA